MKATLRRCIACREMKTKENLIKVTNNSKEGLFAVGTKYTEGRGAYVCKNSECIKKCRSKRGFNRAFKKEVPEEIYNRVEEILEGK